MTDIERLTLERDAWKSRARAAANSIDALLLYATVYPTDSHALAGYALLEQILLDLGERRAPRTVQTFGYAASGRSIIPPLASFPED